MDSTNNGSPASPSPAPLSFGDFQSGTGSQGASGSPLNLDLFAGGSPTTSGPQFTLDASDRLTLQTTLNLIRVARAGSKSPDNQIAKTARVKLIQSVSYLSGFLDGAGLIDTTPANAGFGSLFSSNDTPPLDLLLDQLDDGITQLLTTDSTRDVRKAVKSILSGIGDAYIGIGAGLLVAAAVSTASPA